ncbi:voltage-dependent calcium channel beta subunit-associated regulatory protein-like [Scleropages formosus]|uniref:voltage-dependent calcium channel beta subunit-associated regulatory protein-like n=1 Tax=Scleropages formosus TaxID=113540 RepID=UPI0010FA6F39|nr:voltage-dependent calcium channel beta subunit-associated regulatory protein-like [Scleropages formosus]
MSHELPVLKSLAENVTDAPQEPREQDGYVLLLVLLCVFVGGTLVLLSVLLILCRRCCEGGRRYSRASDDPEKTNTTYVEESQPVQEITIRVDEAERQSASSGQDEETERFLSLGSTGRRVSFNESALFEHSRKAQEKGRRYTLTEGDFHHLKNARLTQLHLPSPALNILTIPECESPERPASKGQLSIFQLPHTAPTRLGLSPSSRLPGDTLNFIVDRGLEEPQPCRPSAAQVEVMEARPGGGGRMNSTQGAGVQLFTRLRRHASLEGVSPYFSIKKWKLDSIHRASSLDMRGSPKRRQVQRQRAASESKDHDQDECDSSRLDFIQYIARAHAETYRPGSPSVSIPAPPSSPPPSLGRLELEVEPVMEASGSGATGLTSMAPEPQEEGPEAGAGLGAGPVSRQESCEHQTLYRDIWMLRASLEQYASSDQSSNNDRDSVRSEAGSMSSLVGGASRGPLTSCPSQDIGDELEAELPGEPVGRKQGGKQDSVDSERGSDGESGNRKLLQMDSGYASIEAPSRVPEELRLFVTAGGGGAKAKTASEKRHFFTSSGRKGSVCESFESRLSEEELEEEEAPGGSVAESPVGWQPRRDFSIDEKTDALFHEFLRRDPQFDQQESPARQKHRSSRVHLRKQWQRTKQRSDPGVRLPPGLERQRATLRRGDSANYPLDTRYHSTLSRIVSAADEEASEEDKAKGSPSHSPPPDGRPPGSGYGPQTVTLELADKLVSSLEDKLYAGLRAAKGSCECVATAVHVSPDHSPV